MTIQIELDPETEIQLRAKAEASGMEPSGFASKILRKAMLDSSRSRRRGDLQEFRATLDAMAAHAIGAPDFDDQNWSRAVIYGDHD